MSIDAADIVKDFKEYIAEWSYCYSHVAISYIAVIKDHVPKIIFGRVWLSSYLHLSQFPEFRYQSAHLQAQRVVVPLQYLQQQVLDIAGEGKVSLGLKNNIEVAIPDGNAISMYFPKSESIDPISGFVARTIFLNGIGAHELHGDFVSTVTLNKELKTSESPFDGLDDLATFLGLYDLKKGNQCGVEYLALAPGQIAAESEMKSGTLTAVCEVGKDLHNGNIKITYIAYKQDGTVERSHIEPERIQWSLGANGVQRGVGRITVKDAVRIKLFLCYGPGLLHERELVDSVVNANPLAAIFEVYDREFKLLGEYYSGRGRNDELFEKSLSYALSFHGFYAIHLGNHHVLNNGPDVIAVTPKGNILLLECTLRDIDNNNKLSKLRMRYNEVLKALIKRGLGHLEVLPMIVTSVSRNGIQSDLQKVMGTGIAVLCAEELSSFIEGFGMSKDADEMFEFFKRFIQEEPGILGRLGDY